LRCVTVVTSLQNVMFISGSTSSWVLDWCPGCFWRGEYMCTERSISGDLQGGWWLLVPECLHSQGQRLHRCYKWSQI